jgi:hypothetical protein
VSPSPLPSSSPAACGNFVSSTTAFIVMSFEIAPVTASPYGSIYGYALANGNGTFPFTAQVINLKTTDVIQFFNADNASTTTPLHSAVGLPQANPPASPFPAIPYSFPLAMQQPMGLTITTVPWSSGRLTPGCYSQQFTLSHGIFLFGDYDYYDLINMRDVMTVN